MPDRELSKPIRVALVTTELGVGGAERCLANLACRIDRTRFEPTVYSLAHRPDEERSLLVQQLEAADVPVRFIGVSWYGQFFRAATSLAAELKSQKVDLVQSFLFHGNMVSLCAARIAGIKSVCVGVRVADRSRARIWPEWLFYRFASKIVCVSEDVKRFCAERVRIPSDSLCVIPNGVDFGASSELTPIDISELGLTPEHRAILTVGRLSEQKGLDWLLSLMPRVFASFPQHDLLVVGDGPLRDRYASLAKELGVSNRVHFCGWRADVARIYPACDLFVLPSRYEGMPNALMEAMAAGLPVVATDVEGVRELLGPLASEQIVPFGDDEAMLTTIQQPLQYPNGGRERGVRNRERICAKFSLEKMASEYESVWNSVLS